MRQLVEVRKREATTVQTLEEQGAIGAGFDQSAIPSRLFSGGQRKCSHDIFLLPLVQGTEFKAGDLSRKVARRLGRRLHFEKEVNRTVDALNQMYGAPVFGRLQSGCNYDELSAGQHHFLEFIEQAIGEAGSPEGLTGPEALMALRVSEGYEELPTSCPLASFERYLRCLWSSWSAKEGAAWWRTSSRPTLLQRPRREGR